VISRPLKLGFLASGNGSSAEAIVRAIMAGELAAEPRLMVSNKRDASALGWARSRGVPSLCIPTIADPEAADAQLAQAMADHDVDLVVLSGYLRRLGPRVLTRYAGRILNIHPGPLPEFGGEGMYGARVHEAVLASGRANSAIVIHLVDEEYDHGPELARRVVPITTGDTPKSLEERVKAAEPAFFVETLQQIASGELELP
jgi:phosphoribosylglycinamide formyltransferase 1